METPAVWTSGMRKKYFNWNIAMMGAVDDSKFRTLTVPGVVTSRSLFRGRPDYFTIVIKDNHFVIRVVLEDNFVIRIPLILTDFVFFDKWLDAAQSTIRGRVADYDSEVNSTMVTVRITDGYRYRLDAADHPDFWIEFETEQRWVAIDT
jgi:predicted pyridoxine 5'-phosphate oxidase superfamily flavin-nucleotide-binding protein